jgi:hypothetical protein
LGLGVDVRAVQIGLPDLDERIADRRTARREQPPAEVRDLTDGSRLSIVHDDQIVVGVERQAVGVERPVAGHGRRDRLRERGASAECRGAECQPRQEFPSRREHRPPLLRTEPTRTG